MGRFTWERRWIQSARKNAGGDLEEGIGARTIRISAAGEIGVFEFLLVFSKGNVATTAGGKKERGLINITLRDHWKRGEWLQH